jgi:hypothetical protein
MAFVDSYALAQDAVFLTKITVCIRKTALAVAGETPSGKDQSDAKRHALAVSVLQDEGVWAERFAYAVVAGGIITGASSDSDIEFTVNSVWSDMAGVSGKEL